MAKQAVHPQKRLLQLRLPTDLAAWLKERAERNTRTTTGEIVARLKESRQREEANARTP
jgi:hypothetical protein